MAWLRIALTEDEQRIVQGERESHTNACVRRRLWVLWLLHCGLKREQAAQIVGVCGVECATRRQPLRPGRLGGSADGGAGVPADQRVGSASRRDPAVVGAAAGADHCGSVSADQRTHRRGTSADSSATILEGIGLEVAMCPRDSSASEKNLAEHAADQTVFLDEKLTPALAAAQTGQGHVFFVDAAHFVFGTFLCCLWSFTRLFVRAASGRQRFNVLGAWNAVTRELVVVTNTTVVNTATMCELLLKIAALKLTGPVTLVLDNARYQRNAVVIALAEQSGITLLFLPSYSPNLNLIERLWKFTKRRSLYGRYHPTFADFRSAIEQTLDHIPTTHAADLASLMTLNFQRFENVLLMAA